MSHIDSSPNIPGIQMKEQGSDPSVPSAGYCKMYVKAGMLYLEDSSSTVRAFALSGTLAPVDGTYITQTPNGTLTNEQAMSLLATGIIKNTTTTGVFSIATAGTDYTSPAGTETLQNKTITLSSLIASALSLIIGGFKGIFTHTNTADRTYSLPDYNGTLATLAGSEALSNKTITASTLVSTALSLLIGGFKAIFTHANSADRTYMLPNYDATIATVTGTETLTNKTLTSPVISGGTVNNAVVGGTTAAAVTATVLKGDTLQVNAGSLDSKAVAEFDSTTKGLLIPRMTTTQRDAIASPPDGLLIYNTTTHKFSSYESSAWAEMGAGGGGGHIIQAAGVDQTARTHLNFIGATVADNAGANSTDITVTGSGGGALPAILARYKQGTGQTFLNGVDVPVNFDTLDFDTNSAVTVGAAWKFTAPRSGTYQFSVRLVMTSAPTQQYFTLRKNGAGSGAVLSLTQSTSWDYSLHGTTTIVLVAGDYIQLVLTNASGGTVTSANGLPDYSYVDIHSIDNNSGGVAGITTATKSFQQRTVLADVVLASDGTIDMTSIDQTYDDIEVVGLLRGTLSGTQVNLALEFNGDTTATNYYRGLNYGGGGIGNDSAASNDVGYVAGDSGPAANDFSFIHFRIPRYTEGKYKTTHILDSILYADTGANQALTVQTSLYWKSTAAINRIKIKGINPGTGADAGNWKTGSKVQIVGIKAETVVTAVTGNALVATKKNYQQRTVLYDNTLGSAGSWDVSGIDQTYDHLELISDLRGTNASNFVNAVQSFNNDTTDANYITISVYGQPGATAGNDGIAANRTLGLAPAASATADRFSQSRIFIADYAKTDRQKRADLFNLGPVSDSSEFIIAAGSLWKSTAAINRITLAASTGNFVAGSRLQIIGIKAEQVVTDIQGAFVSSMNSVNQNTALIQDQKAQNTSGGGFTSGSWQTRDLNTIVNNMTTPVTLSSNQLTLQAGTYEFLIWSPSYTVNRSQARLQNITDGTTALYGSSTYQGATDTATVYSIIVGVITLTSAKTFEVQHKSSATNGTNGFGVEANLGTEIYTSVKITRLDTPTIGVTSPKRGIVFSDDFLSYASGGATKSVTRDGGSITLSYSYQNSPANGDYFTFSFMVAAGTYTLQLFGSIENDNGIIDWYQDDTLILAGQDWYNASGATGAFKTISVTFLSSGYHAFKGVINGKNGASSNYYWTLIKASIIPLVD